MKFAVRFFICALVCTLILAFWMPLPLAAEGGLWDRPVNLSVSGVATGPQLVHGEEGILYAYWWDRYDGLTVVRVDVDELATPWPVPIQDLAYDFRGNVILNQQTGAAIRDTVQSGGALIGDRDGRVNAFFPGTTAAPIAPLRQTSTTLGSADWAEPRSIAPGVAALRSVTGPDGRIHLLFMYPERTDDQVPGVYYMRSDDGGATWSGQVLVAESLYVRMATEADANLDLAVAEGGRLYATWTKPGIDAAFYTWSWDDGNSWVQPQMVDPNDLSATHVQIGLGAEGHVLLVWQGTMATGEPGLMMSYTRDWGWNWTMPQRILAGLPIRGHQLALHSLPDGRVLLVAGGQRDGPSLAVWQPEGAEDAVRGGWSDITNLRYPAYDSDTHAVASVTHWQVGLIGGDTLHLVGKDSEDDVWLLRTQLSDEIWSYPDRAAWSDQQSPASPEWLDMTWLARAGATVPTRIVAGRDGQMQAFWWHIYQGLTSAWFDGTSWMRPQHASALAQAEAGQGQLPTEAELVGDGLGAIHAFWLEGEPLEPDEGNRTLLHSTLQMGEHVWGEPAARGQAIAWRAAFGKDGTHYLLTLERQEEDNPGGVFVRQRPGDGEEWTEPALLYEMADAGAAGDNARLALAVQDDVVFAAWDEGEAGVVRWTRSEDGGENWSEPLRVLMQEAGARWPLLAALSGDALLLYQTPWNETEGALHQVFIDAGGRATAYPESVLSGLSLPIDGAADLRLQILDQDNVLGVYGVGKQEIVVALWNRGQAPDPSHDGWSLLQDVDLVSQDRVYGRPIEWSSLDVAVAGDRFRVLGLGEDGELGVLSREATRESWLGAGAPTWSHAERIGPMGAHDRAISFVNDAQGRVHAMWSAREGMGEPGAALWYAQYVEGRWTSPSAIIEPPDGVAESPSIVAVGERLHAVWAGATGGQIRYASAFSVDASTSPAWPQPLWLPSPSAGRDTIATHPQIRVDLEGRLHVVYAMPINQERGIYYTRSENGGGSWTAAVPVFDAAAAGWAMVDRPIVAVDHDGVLYVAWMRMAPHGMPRPLALHLAVSADDGVTWSAPKLVAEGRLAGVQFVVGRHGEPHLIWHEIDEGLTTWHIHSLDAGVEWSLPARVRGFSQLAAEADLVTDGMGRVYLVGIVQGEDERPHLLQAGWDSAGEEWVLDEERPLSAGIRSVAVTRLALEPMLGQLDLLLHAELVDETEQEHTGLLHMRRGLEPLDALPQPIGDLISAGSPEPTPEAQPTPTQHPTVRMDAPPPRDDIIELGFFSVSTLSIAGVLMAALMVGGILITRLVKRR